MPYKHIIKILIAGDGGVGKTTLLYRCIEDKFIEDTKITIGVEWFSKKFNIDEHEITLQIWDFGGQKQFRFLHQGFALGAKGALLLFDLTRFSTLENLEQWVEICRSADPKLPLLLLGSKADLEENISVDENIVLKIKEDLNLFNYLKISSKTGKNIELAFDLLIREILKNILLKREK